MINVIVMYADLTIQKELLEDIGKLPKDKVLFLLVEDDERKGKLKNIAACHGFDNYALCRRRDNSYDWVMLFGWDEDDFVWRRISKCKECPNREVVDMPVGIMHVIFRGGNVSTEKWTEAKAKFNSEMI